MLWVMVFSSYVVTLGYFICFKLNRCIRKVLIQWRVEISCDWFWIWFFSYSSFLNIFFTETKFFRINSEFWLSIGCASWKNNSVLWKVWMQLIQIHKSHFFWINFPIWRFSFMNVEHFKAKNVPNDWFNVSHLWNI